MVRLWRRAPGIGLLLEGSRVDLEARRGVRDEILGWSSEARPQNLKHLWNRIKSWFKKMFQIFWARVRTSRAETSSLRIWSPKPLVLACGRKVWHVRGGPENLKPLGGPRKSETTCVNQLIILFHKCGVRFAAARPSSNATGNRWYSFEGWLTKRSISL